jgi:hypothetical protein
MKTTISLIALCVGSTFVISLAGCGGDDTVVATADSGTHTDSSVPDSATGDTGTTDTGTADSGDAGPPAPPTLGAQIDRMGRPAINTATNHAFDANLTTKDAAKNAWNQNSNPSTWVSTFKAEIAANLGILDSLDNVCGNQLFANMSADAGATRYATFAGVLADDRLWVKTDATACTTYLAVEANATGVVVNSDCGGRVPSYDVLKVTYSAVAIGALSGVTDGVTSLAKSKITTFPYLAPAQ